MSDEPSTYELMQAAESELTDAIQKYSRAKSAVVYGEDVEPEIVTSWVLVSESAFADGSRGIARSHSDGMTEWQISGMLQYSLMTMNAHVTLDVLSEELPEGEE